MVDLQKFCDDETEIGARLYITTPWSAGENTFAANGHIIIRVERRADVPARKNAPALTELIQWFLKEPEKWYPVPEVHPIAELPGAEIGPMGPLEPARFRFKGGEGLLMPRKVR